LFRQDLDYLSAKGALVGRVGLENIKNDAPPDEVPKGLKGIRPSASQTASASGRVER